MNQEEVLASVDLIKAFLSSRAGETVTGAILGELVRKVTPELNLKELYPTGQKTLSRFVDQFFSGFLEPVGRKGSDVLYSISSDVVVHSVLPDYQLWLTFVRPNSMSTISVELLPPKLIFSKVKTVNSNALDVASVTSSELFLIRKAFVESLPIEKFDSSVYQLSNSYSEWLESVRGQGGKLFNSWSSFRIGKLHELFKRRLEELKIPEKDLSFLSALMERCQLSAPKKSIGQKNQEVYSKPLVNSEGPISATATPGVRDVFESDEVLRAAVLEAVRRMSIMDIRGLNIPAGLMLDAIAIVLKK